MPALTTICLAGYFRLLSHAISVGSWLNPPYKLMNKLMAGPPPYTRKMIDGVGDMDVDDRVAVFKVGDSVSRVTVKLDDDWDEEGGTLEITFSKVTAPNPLELTSTDAANVQVEIYKFTSSSNKEDGDLTPLKVYRDAANDNVLVDSQPYVSVGNVASGEDSGTITISEAKVYQGEDAQTITITFKPKGPIYDSTLWITIPNALVTG